MTQISSASFKSDNNKIMLICDADTSLGDLHDFLMAAKGDIVSRMVKAQKEEEEVSEKIKSDSDELNEENEGS